MARVAISLVCTDKEREELERISRSRTGEIRMVERSQIILCCLEGKSNKEIAVRLGLRPNTVGHWRKCFAAKGLEGLQDAKRPGKPPDHPPDELKARILKQIEQPPPDGMASWDGGSLAKALGVSADMVWRLLRKEGIQLSRQRSWCVSTDPQFATKSADIIGLYLNPPHNALVLCVDEKPSIQAIERESGFVKTSSGKVVRGLKSTYKRHGTLNLFAALNVMTGVIRSKTTASKKRIDFQEFLDDVMGDVPPEQEVHVIVDNYCTHKKNDAWLANHPNVTFHYTPTSASWLNQVEIWFGIMTRKALRGASFTGIEELTQSIQSFVDAYNENAEPFVWRKREVKGSQLRNTIGNLCN